MKVLFTTIISILLIGCTSLEGPQLVRTTSEHTQNLEDILAVVENRYVFPRAAEKISLAIRANYAQLGSAAPSTSLELTKWVQKQLREMTRDAHISVHIIEPGKTELTHVMQAATNQLIVTHEEIEQNGIKTAYVKFDKFSGKQAFVSQLTSILESLSNNNAIVLDLRYNGGGDPNTAALLASYFVADGTLLWSIQNREGQDVMQSFAKSTATMPAQLSTIELAILTSLKTGSAAEAFSYTMKHLGRATMIGERTGGAAHLVEMLRVNNSISIRIPVARPVNPITKSNWEGSGVLPDIAVEPNKAKSVALEFLSSKLNQDRGR